MAQTTVGQYANKMNSICRSFCAVSEWLINLENSYQLCSSCKRAYVT